MLGEGDCVGLVAILRSPLTAQFLEEQRHIQIMVLLMLEKRDIELMMALYAPDAHRMELNKE